MQVDRHVKYSLFLFAFNQNLKKIPNVKLHENPSGGRHAVWREQTDGCQRWRS